MVKFILALVNYVIHSMHDVIFYIGYKIIVILVF